MPCQEAAVRDIAPALSMTVWNMDALSIGVPAARVKGQEVTREKLVLSLGKRLCRASSSWSPILASCSQKILQPLP